MSTGEPHEIARSEGVVTRKGFLRYGLLATAAAFTGSRLFGQTSGTPGASPVVPDRPPPIEDEPR